RQAFDDGILRRVDRLNEYARWRIQSTSHEDWQKEILADIESEQTTEFYQKFTFETWLNNMAWIIGEHIQPQYDMSDAQSQELGDRDPYLPLMLKRDLSGDDGTFGFFSDDLLAVYRAMLKAVPSDAEVELDFTDLVGWVEEENYAVGPPKIILLT